MFQELIKIFIDIFFNTYFKVMVIINGNGSNKTISIDNSNLFYTFKKDSLKKWIHNNIK